MQTRDWLARQPCTPCRAGAPSVSDSEVADLMPLLPAWELTVRDGGRRLERTYTRSDFRAALALAVRIGELAEAADHHPLLVVEWGRLSVSWWTHAIGGLHRNDFVLAAQCDVVATD